MKEKILNDGACSKSETEASCFLSLQARNLRNNSYCESTIHHFTTLIRSWDTLAENTTQLPALHIVGLVASFLALQEGIGSCRIATVKKSNCPEHISS